jgi:hypothetical protein
MCRLVQLEGGDHVHETKQKHSAIPLQNPELH